MARYSPARKVLDRVERECVRGALTLRQLDEVLDAVDDLDAAELIDEADVARAEPAVVGERLARLLLVLVVAGERGGASAVDLAARERLVGGGVALRTPRSAEPQQRRLARLTSSGQSRSFRDDPGTGGPHLEGKGSISVSCLLLSPHPDSRAEALVALEHLNGESATIRQVDRTTHDQARAGILRLCGSA